MGVALNYLCVICGFRAIQAVRWHHWYCWLCSYCLSYCHNVIISGLPPVVHECTSDTQHTNFSFNTFWCRNHSQLILLLCYFYSQTQHSTITPQCSLSWRIIHDYDKMLADAALVSAEQVSHHSKHSPLRLDLRSVFSKWDINRIGYSIGRMQWRGVVRIRRLVRFFTRNEVARTHDPHRLAPITIHLDFVEKQVLPIAYDGQDRLWNDKIALQNL